MSSLGFDPYAQLANQSGTAAKPANLAKAENKHLTLASLATLASAHSAKPSLWNATDWQEYYDERAGVAEYCGGILRDKAERMAFESCVVRWLDMHPPIIADEKICPHCNQPNGVIGTSCVPVLSGGGGHIWLHHRCLDDWRKQRREKSVEALSVMGVKHHDT